MPAELVAVVGRLNNAFRRLGSGWATFVEAQRHPSNSYPDSRFPDAASALVDAEHKANFEEAGAHYAGIAYVTATVTVWDKDPRIADEKLRLVEKVIQGRDFTAMAETINAVDAWLGSLPSHVYANVRQPPISTLNLAHMIPLSAVWAGPERDEHFAAPPLLFGKAEGSTPFRFSLHVGDVDHTLVVGPTGAGKSVLLALMALQFRCYRNALIFACDFGGSVRAGGARHAGRLARSRRRSDGRIGFLSQPSAAFPCRWAAERAWAADWIGAVLACESVAITPEVKEHLWTALSSLASAPVEERTVTGLCVLLQSNDLKQALRPYCIGDTWGRLLDAEAEHLGTASVQAFETEGLIGTKAAPAVLASLFHRIEDRLDGAPTLIIVDEGWLALGPVPTHEHDDGLLGGWTSRQLTPPGSRPLSRGRAARSASPLAPGAPLAGLSPRRAAQGAGARPGWAPSPPPRLHRWSPPSVRARGFAPRHHEQLVRLKRAARSLARPLVKVPPAGTGGAYTTGPPPSAAPEAAGPHDA